MEKNTLDEPAIAVNQPLPPALEILKILKENNKLLNMAEANGITPELLDGIHQHLPGSGKAELKRNDIAFYLTRLTLAGELERGSGSSLSIRKS